MVLAERIRERVRELRITHRDCPDLIVTISLGIASTQLPCELATPAELVKMADEALYQAKARGRDRICSANTPEGEKVRPLKRSQSRRQ
jgi:diguanylate cyclase (GGDEF)-like protein